MSLSLLGEHQAKNCSLAIAAFEIVRPHQTVRTEILSRVKWAGRFDVHKGRINGSSKTIVLDGAHNPGAIRRFVRTWKASLWGKKKRTFIFGVLKDKDYKGIVKELYPVVKSVVLTPIDSKRNIDMGVLKETWKQHLPNSKIICADSIRDAFKRNSKEKVVGVTGSLYLVGDAVKVLETPDFNRG